MDNDGAFGDRTENRNDAQSRATASTAASSSSSAAAAPRVNPPQRSSSSTHHSTGVPSLFSSNQIPFHRRPDNRPPSAAQQRPQTISSQSSKTRTTSFSHNDNPRSPQSTPYSPDADDRIFPIRSYVSVDPTPTPSLKRHHDNYFAGPPSVGGDDDRKGSTSRAEKSPEQADQEMPLESSAQTEGLGPIDKEFQQPGVSSDNPFGISFRRGSATLAGSQSAGPASNTATEFSLRSSGQGYNILSEDESQKSASVDGSVRSVRSRRNAPSPGPTASRHSKLSRAEEEEQRQLLITARFKHVVTEEGHAIITGRDGETLQRCEDEPIHIPGAIQCFGGLIALKEDEDKLVVRIASENSKRLLGYSPQELFALSSFTDILSDEQTENLLDHIDFIKDDDMDIETNGPEVFTLSIRPKGKRALKLWCAIHINPNIPDLMICEFELEDDSEYPLVAPNDVTPEPPEDTLSSEPTEQELLESTVTKSRPLRVLRSARKRKGEAAAMEVFNIMSQVQEQLAEATDLDSFLKVLVGVVKELTGFHRVMMYQFDTSYNGKVVTELVDPRATKDLYKGLHFPASDIPKQARDLYKINKVRLLYDRDHETARLVCRTLEDLERPLDLTHSYLRAMSPIHVKYLRNMAVRSSMSISVNAFNELWGLISCHTYGSRGTRVSFPIRKMCRLIGDSASRNIERLSYASRLQARKLINTAPSSKNPSGYIIASSEDLLALFNADFGLLSIHDETKVLGRLEGTQEALVLLEYLRMRKFTSVLTTQDVRFDLQDLKYPPGFKVIAGLLLVPLTAGGNDFIVFFRKGQMKEVKWAGNPYEKFVREGTEGFLEPRKSFKMWSETVVGRCREWTEEEVETAAVLCLVYGKFIEVWRQKEAALQNTQLTKLLLANSAHEVRTPLNAIINYLEIAMEGSLDQETRDNLSKSHSASKSLVYVINDLLDLTKTEAQNALVHSEVFDLPTTIREAANMFQGDAKRKEIALEVIEHPEVPGYVLGDQRRVRQAVTNVVANAIQATSEGGVKVEIVVVDRSPQTVEIDVVVQDTGVGIPPDKLDTLFAELEQAQEQDDEPTGIDALESPEGSGSQALLQRKKDPKRSVLSLGLAVVARIVRNMSGQLRVKSEPGQGSRFVLSFPFDLPPTDQGKNESRAIEPAAVERSLAGAAKTSSDSLVTPLWSSNESREVLLVNRATTPRRGSSSGSETSPVPKLQRDNSVGSEKSARSRRSYASQLSKKSASSINSGRSEADRLIEAMQEPHVLDRPSMSRRSRSSFGGVSTIAPETSTATPSVPSSPTVRERSRSWELDTGPKVPEHLRTEPPSDPGTRSITGSVVPLTAIRMPDESLTGAERKGSNSSSLAGALTSHGTSADPRSIPRVDTHPMRVLVAEDDPINSKIIQKRLDKLGHNSSLTVNGEECAGRFVETPTEFDVVLMDMQMPIVDGISSAKMIRSFEKTRPNSILSSSASMIGRIPIIAVSASLLEKDRQKYIDAGFDAWILKPIAFARLNELMRAVLEEDLREACLYRPGAWEHGGWFHTGKRRAVDAETEPSGRVPFSGPSVGSSTNSSTDSDATPTQTINSGSGEGSKDIKAVIDDVDSAGDSTADKEGTV